jgi:hypothetical protein
MGRVLPSWTWCALTRGCGALLLLTAAVGCGAGTGTVKGQVTYQDKPVPGGLIMFVPTDSKHNSVTAEIDENGNYELTAPVGEVRISVDNQNLKPPEPSGPPSLPPDLLKKIGKVPHAPKKGEAPPEAPAEAGGTKPRGKYREIPSKYYQIETSKLTYTVTSGPQKKDIELK